MVDEEVTAAEAARLTGFSERTIRRKIAANKIPARRISSNRYAIYLADLPLRNAVPDACAAGLLALEARLRTLELQHTLLLAFCAADWTSQRSREGSEGTDMMDNQELRATLFALIGEVRQQFHKLHGNAAQ